MSDDQRLADMLRMLRIDGVVRAWFVADVRKAALREATVEQLVEELQRRGASAGVCDVCGLTRPFLVPRGEFDVCQACIPRSVDEVLRGASNTEVVDEVRRRFGEGSLFPVEVYSEIPPPFVAQPARTIALLSGLLELLTGPTSIGNLRTTFPLDEVRRKAFVAELRELLGVPRG